MVAQVCNHQILNTEAVGLLLLPGQATSVSCKQKERYLKLIFPPEDSYLSHPVASPVPALPLGPAGGSGVLCTAARSFRAPHAQHTFWG